MSLYECRSMYASYHGDLDRMRARLHELDERDRGDDFGMRAMPVMGLIGILATAAGAAAGSVNLLLLGVTVLLVGVFASLVAFIDSRVRAGEHARLMARIRLMEDDINGESDEEGPAAADGPCDSFRE